MDHALFVCIAIFVTHIASHISRAEISSRSPQVLSSPTQYVSLTGDLDVKYNFSSLDIGEEDDQGEKELQGEAQLVNAVNNSTLTVVNEVLKSSTGKIIFKCGTVLGAGHYLVRMVIKSKNNGSVDSLTLVSNTIDVRWPSFKFTVPLLLETYTADVSITLESTGVACYPKGPSHPTWLELAYYGRNESVMGEPNRQRVQELSEFYRMTTRDVTIRCIHFDQAGFYRLHLSTGAGPNNSMASSDFIRVMWSEEYRIRVEAPSIFPCVQGVTLFYQYPKCILPRDRIRLYGRKRTAAAPVASPAIFSYLSERRVDKGRDSVTFPCHFFSETLYVEYCFKYVSVAMSGAVTEVYSKCVPTHGRTADTPIDGKWGEWSSWSSCKTTCGSGTRIRHRVCDNPRPSNGGLFCVGEAMVAATCVLPKCPERITTQSPVDSYRMKEECRCGCTLNLSSGSTYIASSFSHCTSSSTWIILAPLTTVLRFTFLHFHLNDSTECLQVRDGNLQSSELLLHETGQAIPHPVTTTFNVALLRYHPSASESRKIDDSGGFIVRVDVWHHNYTIVPITQDALQDYKLFSSPFHLAAILFCAILMCFSLALALHHFVQNKKRQGPTQSPFESPFGSTPGSLHDGYQQFQPVTSTTSVSDISLGGRRFHTRRQHRSKAGRWVTRSQDSFENLTSSRVSHGTSPEDFLRDSKIFESSPSTSTDSSPVHEQQRIIYPTTLHKPPLGASSALPKDTRHGPVPLKQSPLTPSMPRKLPIATVSPQPARTLAQQEESLAEQKFKGLYEKKPEMPKEKKVQPKKSEPEVAKRVKRSSVASRSEESATEGESRYSSDLSTKEEQEQRTPTGAQDHQNPPRQGGATRGGVPMRPRRGRSGAMMASLSEFSLSGTDADFEYDYYDYGVHNNPGSYFSQYPEALSWLPPFLPVQPPFDEGDLPLHDFGRPLDALGGPPMAPEGRLQESSADSINTSADGGSVAPPAKTPSKDSPGHGGPKFAIPTSKSHHYDFSG